MLFVCYGSKDGTWPKHAYRVKTEGSYRCAFWGPHLTDGQEAS